MSSSPPSSRSIGDDESRRQKLADILGHEAQQPSSGATGEAQTYQDGLAAILDQSHDEAETNGKARQDDDQEDEEAFLYPGADHAANIFDGEAESGPSSPRSYGARMRSILGSSEGDDDDDAKRNEGEHGGKDDDDDNDDDEAFVYPDDGKEDEETASALPDRTIDSIRDMAISQRPGFKWRRGSSAADLSMSTSTTMTDMAGEGRGHHPARPPEYPTLSRLRAKVPGVASHSRSSSYTQRSSPFGTVGGFLGIGPSSSTYDVSRSSLTHSRTASTSSSVLGGEGRRSKLFPYGASDFTNAPVTGSDLSQTSSFTSLPPASAAVNGAAAPDSISSSVTPPLADRGLFKWSALRKVAAFFQEGHRSSIITTSSGQSLPQSIGAQTVLSVAGGLVAIGTTLGHVLVFEFSQDLKCILGGAGAGQVTALAFSADHTFLAIGYEKGHVYLYDLAKPTSPSRTVLPMSRQDVASGRKEGHLESARILHVAFVGGRHTAVFTADDQGLAFYHSLGKILGVASNDTLRILGRYPDPTAPPSKRSSLPILSLAALPLGPIDHLADGVHFVALVTPQKLVIVGLKPNARTWYRKSAPLATAKGNEEGRRNEAGACAAWFPAVKPEEATTTQSQRIDDSGLVQPTLAYSFSSQLAILKLVTKRTKIESASNGNVVTNGAAPTYRTDLEFVEHPLAPDALGPDPRPIEALQWLSHELIILVTSTDLRLVDLRVGRVTERESLNPTLSGLVRHPWLANSPRLSASLGPFTTSSMRVFRGKPFFLTSSQVVVGHLLSWADRLLSLVSAGDFLSAIDLCRAYYQGSVSGSLVGLPSDPTELQAVVAGKLRELMSASARYAFAPERLTDGTHVTADGRGVDRTDLFRQLARACAQACLALGDTDFLFGELYNYYSENGIDPLFVGELEPFVLDGQLRTLPIPVSQRLIETCKAAGDYGLAERLLWHVDPMCLDLDQALSLCAEQGLTDAMIWIYNEAMDDWVGPVVELLEPLKKVVKQRKREAENDEAASSVIEGDAEDHSTIVTDAYKVFSYLSVALSGHSFPSQEPITPAERGDKAKQSVYGFVFSGHCVIWPPGAGGRIVLSVDEGQEEMTYPYLRLLLAFDAEAMLDALDVAFEDGWLDEEEEVNGHQKLDQLGANGSGSSPPRIKRQRIIDILLEVTQDTTAARTSPGEAERLFASIFIARNASRYPQFVSLATSVFDALLRSLCTLGDEETREDRQLAAEALLSCPSAMLGQRERRDSSSSSTKAASMSAASPLAALSEDDLLMLESAGFWRILKSAYREVGNWGQLVALLLHEQQEEDDSLLDASPSSGSGIFSQLSDVLSRAQQQQRKSGKAVARSDLDTMIVDATPRLVGVDARLTAEMVDRFFPDRHGDVLEVLSEDDGMPEGREDLAARRQLSYLRCFLDQEGEEAATRPLNPKHLDVACRSTYVHLKTRLEPSDLLRVLRRHSVTAGDAFFDLETVIEAGQSSLNGAAYDAVLWSLDRLGRTEKAFRAVDEFVARMALRMKKGNDDGVEDVVDSLARATRMSVQICDAPSHSQTTQQAMPAEERWYRLLRSMVALIHDVSGGGGDASDSSSAALAASQRVVEETLAAMVTSLSSSSSSTTTEGDISLPSLFRRLVSSSAEKTDGSSPRTFGEVRMVVSAMMSACRLRGELLGVAQRLLGREEAGQFVQLARQRRRGWRGLAAPAPAGSGMDTHAESTNGVPRPRRPTGDITPTGRQSPSSALPLGTALHQHPVHRLASQPPTPGGTMTSPLASWRGTIDRKGKGRSLSFGQQEGVEDYFGTTAHGSQDGGLEQSFSTGSPVRRGPEIATPPRGTTDGVDEVFDGSVEGAPQRRAVRVRLGPMPMTRTATAGVVRR